jgi:hypothetical protein
MTFGTKAGMSLAVLWLVGTIFGYGGAYISYRIEDLVEKSSGVGYLELMTLPSIPGQIIAASLSHRDWLFGEVWENRFAIAWANGCFYLVAGAFILLFVIAIRRGNSSSAST